MIRARRQRARAICGAPFLAAMHKILISLCEPHMRVSRA